MNTPMHPQKPEENRQATSRRQVRPAKKLWIGIFVLLLLAGLSLSVHALVGIERPAPDESIRIGSFNMQVLGQTKLERPNTLRALASIASGFDLLALQELGSNNSSASDERVQAIMHEFLEAVFQAAGHRRFGSIHGDQYAFIYRSDKLKPGLSLQVPEPAAFSYPPLIVWFESIMGQLDFIALNLHTRPSLAESELAILPELAERLSQAHNEPDIVLLGDFNADGVYYEEGGTEALQGFDDFITAIGNLFDTASGDSEYTYDRIQLSRSMNTDWSGRSGVLRFEDLFSPEDAILFEGPESTRGTVQALSDHYPVWAELYIYRDTD